MAAIAVCGCATTASGTGRVLAELAGERARPAGKGDVLVAEKRSAAFICTTTSSRRSQYRYGHRAARGSTCRSLTTPDVRWTKSDLQSWSRSSVFGNDVAAVSQRSPRNHHNRRLKDTWRTRVIAVARFPFTFTLGSSQETRKKLKEELLDAIAPLDRGAAASDEDKARIEKVVRAIVRPKTMDCDFLRMLTTNVTSVDSDFLRMRGPRRASDEILVGIVSSSTINQGTAGCLPDVNADVKQRGIDVVIPLCCVIVVDLRKVLAKVHNRYLDVCQRSCAKLLALLLEELAPVLALVTVPPGLCMRTGLGGKIGTAAGRRLEGRGMRPKLLRPAGPIYQVIDATKLAAMNFETWPFFNKVTAELIPLSSSKVEVQFLFFKILNLISIRPPGRFKGELDTTYLDEDMRISRGDLNNLFVLLMDDRNFRL
ncbi:hypothetical protein CBR_g3139 [Chara braunii]|uniref:Plastid lipid-associated protein/fibrillin conserved domain-containing protein n=1 Tax=Chara braunii TaxID=69332 RepID=A0A388KEV3_CHABU|nr:hypothetical protein CBR_g3139 [Chara braunii]|eukprot:GBG68595.1 hypothetical protein CBR_g3139 [Chara braunii]